MASQQGRHERGGLRAVHLLAGGLALAAVGISTFAALAWRAVRLERAEPAAARRQFEQERARFQGSRPRLTRDVTGAWVGSAASAEAGAPAAETLIVLAYRSDERQLARARVPLWFLEIKGPAVQLSLRGTRLDLERLGLDAGDLRRGGPALLIDEAGPDGDRLLVWTE